FLRRARRGTAWRLLREAGMNQRSQKEENNILRQDQRRATLGRPARNGFTLPESTSHHRA
ncbi:MAG TPA: hypothetical protein PK867_11055, partial [Pirellulales bacterium]|nr:hypothetical protein [Pirellulales bacterium]